jgi:7-keto-8-aminopelargonate synthetase-like enzyme
MLFKIFHRDKIVTILYFYFRLLNAGIPMNSPSSQQFPQLKSKHQQMIEIIDQMLTSSSRLGITHLTTEDEHLDGRHLSINGSDLLNFGSCSYLGLELDKRLINGAIDAVKRYGTQFSSSRAYVSVTLYNEIEELLSKIFNKPVTLASTASLGHMSNIPVLVGEHDAVCMMYRYTHRCRRRLNC